MVPSQDIDVYLISEERYRRWLARVFGCLGRKLIVININYMGLGNRLKLLGIYDANYGLDNATLFWNRQGWVNTALGEIIRIEGITGFREIPINLKPWMVPIITHPTKDHWWPRGFWRFDVDTELPSTYLIERHGRVFPAIDFLFADTPQPYLDRYLRFFARVKPSPAVATRMAAVQLRPQDVAVQIRISLDKGDAANVPRAEAYLRQMRAFPQDTRFFISAMDAAVSAIFREAFGDRVVELPDKQYRSMIDATADMYLLSQPGTLIASRGSTFGEVAWWLGGGRQHVLQIDAELVSNGFIA